MALGGGASDKSRDTHCATCHELVILKLYLNFFSNTTCFYLNLEIILDRFDNVTGTPQVPTLKNLTIASAITLDNILGQLNVIATVFELEDGHNVFFFFFFF